MKAGFFITFEGTDGVGKSTQLKLAYSWLVDQGHSVVMTREPGGGVVSERIRQLLLDPAVRMEGLTELFLYQAARVEHLHKTVRPALAEGKIVLCDRYTDATIAYQGYARGLNKEAPLLNKIATGGLAPKLTILLDLAPGKALARAVSVKSHADRLEIEGVSFQKKVQKGYLALAKKEPKRVKLIHVQSTAEATQSLIRLEIQRSLRGYTGSTSRPSLSH